MTNDKKLMLLAGVLALGMLAGCSSASAASAASGMAGSMPAASEAEEVSSEVRVLPGEEGVIMPIDQGSLEEMKTGSYKFAANISSVDAKKRQMTLTVYGYDAYRAEDVDALDVGSVFSTHLDGAVEAQNVTVEKIEKNEDNGTVSINGGIEEGGVDLWRSGDIYRTITYDGLLHDGRTRAACGRQCDPQRQLRQRRRCAGGDERRHRGRQGRLGGQGRLDALQHHRLHKGRRRQQYPPHLGAVTRDFWENPLTNGLTML